MKTPAKNTTAQIVSVMLAVSVISCSKPTPPEVTTTPVSSITYTTASTGGTVSGDGGAEVTARGVCWNTSANPTISNSKTSDGKGTGPFTSNLTQLTPGTPYYLRAYATNEAGTGYGNEIMFTTTAISLATVTTTVISTTGTTAIIEGNVTADGGSLVTAKGICWGLNANPTVNDNKTSEGTGTGTFRSTLSALSTNITYHVRAYAINGAGIAYGNGETFILTGNKPSAFTLEPTVQSGSGATLFGTVNPYQSETTVTFEYGLTTSYGISVPNYEGVLGPGDYNYNVSTIIDGLEPGKIYHFRIRAENAFGVTYSDDRTFTTLGGKPTASTSEPAVQSGSAAVLSGTVNPNWAETTVTFEYGLTTSYGTSVPNYEGVLVPGDYEYNVSTNIDGLEPGKTYHLRIRAENSLGVTYSDDRTFTTYGEKPTAVTAEPLIQSGSSAILYGTVNPNWAETTVLFEYGLSTSYGTSVPNYEGVLGAGLYDYSVSANIDGLEPGKTYHFRIRAENSLGVTFTADRSFVTPSGK